MVLIIFLLIIIFIFLSDDWTTKAVVLAIIVILANMKTGEREVPPVYVINKGKDKIVVNDMPNFYHEESDEIRDESIDGKSAYRGLFTGSQAERVKKGWLNRPQWQFYGEDMIYNDQVEWWNERSGFWSPDFKY